jgi:uncharacterized protein (UPF0212 family)
MLPEHGERKDFKRVVMTLDRKCVRCVDVQTKSAKCPRCQAETKYVWPVTTIWETKPYLRWMQT